MYCIPKRICRTVAVLLILAGPVPAKETTLMIAPDDLAGMKRLSLSFEIGGASLTISRDNSTDIAVKALVTGSNAPGVPSLTTDISEGTLSATFSSGYDIQFSDMPQQQQWEVIFGAYDVSTLLTITCGGVTGALDLGGLPLRSCSLILGNTDLDIDFSTPTTRPVEILLAAGTGMTVSLHNIGNTDFESLGILGGSNTLDLDFGGTLSGNLHTVTQLSAGGTTNILLPDATEARLMSLMLGGSLQVAGPAWQQQLNLPLRKWYITENYSSSEVKIDFDMRMIGTSLSIERY